MSYRGVSPGRTAWCFEFGGVAELADAPRNEVSDLPGWVDRQQRDRTCWFESSRPRTQNIEPHSFPDTDLIPTFTDTNQTATLRKGQRRSPPRQSGIKGH